MQGERKGFSPATLSIYIILIFVCSTLYPPVSPPPTLCPERRAPRARHIHTHTHTHTHTHSRYYVIGFRDHSQSTRERAQHMESGERRRKNVVLQTRGVFCGVCAARLCARPGTAGAAPLSSISLRAAKAASRARGAPPRTHGHTGRR